MEFSLPGPMLFYYFQLKHVVTSQGPAIEWQQSSAPVFNMVPETVSTKKGFMCRCYKMLVNDFLISFSWKVHEQWERDAGPLLDDQLEEAL